METPPMIELTPYDVNGPNSGPILATGTLVDIVFKVRCSDCRKPSGYCLAFVPVSRGEFLRDVMANARDRGMAMVIRKRAEGCTPESALQPIGTGTVA